MTSKDSTTGFLIEMCGCRVRQHDNEMTLEQTSYARAIQLIPLVAHRRRHPSETIAAEEHRWVIANRRALCWSAKQSVITLQAAVSLIVASATATGDTLTELNTLVRMAQSHAEDKLHYRHVQSSFLSPLQMQHESIDVTWNISADTCAQPRKNHFCEHTQHRPIRSVGEAKFVHKSHGVREVQRHKLPPKLGKRWGTCEPCGTTYTSAS